MKRARGRRSWLVVVVCLLGVLWPLTGALQQASPGLSAAAAAPAGCAQVKAGRKAGVLRWLERCGQIDTRGSAESVGRRALAPHARALGLRADGRDLQLLGVQAEPRRTTVRFAQRHRGVPVYLGQVVVQYSAAGQVELINSQALPELDLDVSPTLEAEQALLLAQATLPQPAALRAPAQRELVIDGTHGSPLLAWHVMLPVREPARNWHVLLDAHSGAILNAWDELWRDQGSGSIYAPNPIQQTGNSGLQDQNDASSPTHDGARVAVVLDRLLPGSTQLKGDYVDTTAPGITGCYGAYVPGSASEPTRSYDYPRSDLRFEEVNVYAAISGVQSWIQSLGFTNIHNRPIPVNVHCTSADNSFYDPYNGALHFGDGGVDDAEDGDIVVHEYGHALQASQVPGWGPGSNTEQRAMGEGFADFLASMYYIDQGAPAYLAANRYCIGEWDAASYNPFVSGNPGSGCLRWIDGRDEDSGADIGRYNGRPRMEHQDGRYWAATLTCIYEGMGANTQARNDLMGLLFAHHFSLAPDLSNRAFEDAVSALLLADRSRLGGANQPLIRACAAQRGLIDTIWLPLVRQ